jgi:RNA polymerase sigma factor (sigma-70 family)
MPGIDHKRFSSLIEPHLDALFRAAFRLTRNRADAEDLVQETCIRACERLDRLQEPVKSWLLHVMHNLFIDGARRARVSPIDARENGTHLAEGVVCPFPTPDESLEQRQRVAQLERAWQRLDRGHQALLALRAEGCTLAEISAITNIAMDALGMRLYRARQNLTRCLRQEQAPSTVPMEAVK